MSRQAIPLRELEAIFQRIVTPGREYEHVDRLEDAQGVMFLCPKCFEANGGSVGTHWVLCWFLDRGVSPDEDPKPGRWGALGTGIDDLELKAGSSSVLLLGGCNWHGFVRGGKATLTC